MTMQPPFQSTPCPGVKKTNLNVLIEQGHIQKLPLGDAFDRFDAKIAPHYHLVCEKCGTVMDFEMPEYSDIHKKAERMSSFKISRQRIDFFGLCDKCQNKTKQSKKMEGAE